MGNGLYKISMKSKFLQIGCHIAIATERTWEKCVVGVMIRMRIVLSKI